VRIKLEERRRDYDRDQSRKDAAVQDELERLGIDRGAYARIKEIELYGQMKKAKLEAKAQEQLIDERARDSAHTREIERLRQVSTMGAAALAATATDNERAAMLAQLARTEAFKGMDSEAILAASASDNPEIAKAFQEKFKMAAMQVEKMLNLKDQHIADVRGMGSNAQNIMGTVETTRAANPVHTNVAMGGGMGMAAWPGMMMPGMGGGMGGGMAGQQPQAPKEPEKKFCTKCGRQQLADAKFCQSCGFQFPGMES
jgi:hypothetical protein